MEVPPGCQIPVHKRVLYDTNEKYSFREEYYLESQDLLSHLDQYKRFEEMVLENLGSDKGKSIVEKIVLETLTSARGKDIVLKNLITNIKFQIAIITVISTFLGLWVKYK